MAPAMAGQADQRGYESAQRVSSHAYVSDREIVRVWGLRARTQTPDELSSVGPPARSSQVCPARFSARGRRAARWGPPARGLAAPCGTKAGRGATRPFFKALGPRLR